MACISVAKNIPLRGSLNNHASICASQSALSTRSFPIRVPGSKTCFTTLTTTFVSPSFATPFPPLNKYHGSFRHSIQAQASAATPSGRPSVSVPALLGIFVVARAAALQLLSGIGQVFASIRMRMKPSEKEERLLAGLKQGGGGSLVLTAVGVAPCFAALSRSAGPGPLTVVAGGMARWLELYSAVLLIRVLLSWFPNIPWEKQPLLAIKDMCDPYLNLFRNILPPLFNALDLSPMLAFLVLGMLSSLLSSSA